MYIRRIKLRLKLLQYHFYHGVHRQQEWWKKAMLQRIYLHEEGDLYYQNTMGVHTTERT